MLDTNTYASINLPATLIVGRAPALDIAGERIPCRVARKDGAVVLTDDELTTLDHYRTARVYGGVELYVAAPRGDVPEHEAFLDDLEAAGWKLAPGCR